MTITQKQIDDLSIKELTAVASRVGKAIEQREKEARREGLKKLLKGVDALKDEYNCKLKVEFDVTLSLSNLAEVKSGEQDWIEREVVVQNLQVTTETEDIKLRAGLRNMLKETLNFELEDNLENYLFPQVVKIVEDIERRL